MTAIIGLVGTDHTFKVLGAILFEILQKNYMRIHRKFANVDNMRYIAYISPYIHQNQFL